MTFKYMRQRREFVKFLPVYVVGYAVVRGEAYIALVVAGIETGDATGVQFVKHRFVGTVLAYGVEHPEEVGVLLTEHLV